MTIKPAPRGYLFLLLTCYFSVSLAADFHFGVVPQMEARKLHSIWRPILDELANTTGHTFTLVGEKDIPAFENAFAAGDYDFVYMNPWHAVIGWEKQGYQPILKDASRQLRGVLVIASDGAVQKITDLEGAEIAFPAPNAFGASLVMRADLKTVYGIDITPVYVDTHSSVYLNAALGTTKAGGGIMSTLNTQPAAVRDRLDILYETRPSSPHPISVHPRVDAETVAEITAAFLALGEDPETSGLLNSIPITRIGKAVLDEYLLLREWGLRGFYATE